MVGIGGMKYMYSLNENDVHVWLCDFTQIPVGIIADYYRLLCESERQRYERFQFDKDKMAFVYSHAMLRLILSSYLKCTPKSIIYHINSFGKPSIKNNVTPALIEFNLTHTDNMAACVITNTKNTSVGIDIEKSNSDVDIFSLFNLSLSKDEQKEITECGDENEMKRRFIELWTLKESLLKSNGTGINCNLSKLSFSLGLPDKIVFDNFSDNLKHGSYYFSQYLIGKYTLSLCIINGNGNMNAKYSLFNTTPMLQVSINSATPVRLGMYINPDNGF